MFKIQCSKKSTGGKAFVSNHPTGSESVQFTDNESQAYIFSDMAQCKNIRDDILQYADNVTILKI